MFPNPLQQLFNRQNTRFVFILLAIASFGLIGKNISFEDENNDELLALECAADENLLQQEEENVYISPLCDCGKKIPVSNETTDPNVFHWCSIESSMRGHHQRIVTYALFGNAHNASVFRRYYSNLRNISLTAEKQYPGYIIKERWLHHVFVHILPYLVLDPSEKDLNNKNLMALKDNSFNLVSNFISKFGEVIYPLVHDGLIKHVCVEVVDRAEYRQKTAQTALDLLQLIPEEHQQGTLFNESAALLPKASAIMNLLKERALDDKVHVRKNALQLLLSVTRRHGRYLTPELLKLLGNACRDVAMYHSSQYFSSNDD